MAADDKGGGGATSVPYTVYDFFGYIFPGVCILAAAYYGWVGPLNAEPGAGTTVGIVAAAYVLGQVNGALANWLQPLFWGRLPGMSFWTAKKNLFPPTRKAEEDAVTARLRIYFECDATTDLDTLYDLSYTALQQNGADGMLKMMNQQIAFFRNMATAALVAVGLSVAYWYAGHGDHLQPLPWIPALLAAALAFVYRYRKFWRQFGDNVIRGIRVLVSAPGPKG